MSGFKSGLSYEQLKAIVDAGAVDRLGKGSIRKNGKRYQAKTSYQAALTDSDGNKFSKRIYLTHTFNETQVSGRNKTRKYGEGGTKDLLTGWIAQIREDARKVAGIAADPTSPVSECIEHWIAGRESRGTIRHSTATFYRNAAKRIYRYPLASAPLNELTKSTVQAMVDDLSKRLARKTVKSSFDVLDVVCKEMLGSEHNPCKGVSLPRMGHNSKKSDRPNALSYDGVARCNSLMDDREKKSQGTDYIMLGARIALNTGMRAEEVTGLRWRDVDLKTKTIHVCNVIQRAELVKTDSDGNAILGKNGAPKTTYAEFDEEPKTKNSARDIPITDELSAILTAHRAYTTSLLRKLVSKGTKRPPIGTLYVLGGIDGKHMSPHRLGINWGKFAKSRKIIGTEGQPVTFHDLRHTFATRAIAAGIDVATVSRILGHAEISVTLNKYVNSDEATKRAAIERMAEVFSMREQPTANGVTPFRTGTEG